MNGSWPCIYYGMWMCFVFWGFLGDANTIRVVMARKYSIVAVHVITHSFLCAAVSIVYPHWIYNQNSVISTIDFCFYFTF